MPIEFFKTCEWLGFGLFVVFHVIGFCPICVLVACRIKTIKGGVLKISSYIGGCYLACQYVIPLNKSTNYIIILFYFIIYLFLVVRSKWSIYNAYYKSSDDHFIHIGKTHKTTPLLLLLNASVHKHKLQHSIFDWLRSCTFSFLSFPHGLNCVKGKNISTYIGEK